MAVTYSKISTNNSILSDSTTNLIATVEQVREFGLEGDYVELNVYDTNNTFIYQNPYFTKYRIPGGYQANPSGSFTQELEFNPDQDITNLGFNSGIYKIEYNILRPKIVNTFEKIFFIQEISADRTELRITTNNVDNGVIREGVFLYINEIQNLNYFKEFYINLGNGILLPAINIALDENITPVSLLIKLLNPLPQQYATNTLLSISEKISDTQLYQVITIPDPIEVTYPSLRGPNFDLDIDNIRANPTDYYNLNQISTSTSSINSQLQALLGLVSSSQFQINVDYTDYSNFVHYSSIARRLDGFYYKLGLIENYTFASASAASVGSITSQQDAQNYQNRINNVIQEFDGYEQFLYYESGSYSWPKTTSTKPYINVSTSSLVGHNWYVAQSTSASNYDNKNQDYLVYSLPTYITENSDNESLFKFIDSIGTMFDEIWLYTKAITDLYQAKNSLSEGISKDLVYFALQSMGVNVYTDQDGTDVFNYLYGVNSNGNYLPATSSYQTLVSASQYQIPGQDIQKGIYKRIYHNLPLLLKSKGTTRFIQYLNTIFGIPSTVMSYIEYGGVDKVTSSFEYEYDRFTYGLDLSGSNTVSVPWVYTSQSLARTGFNDIAPNGIELRFKAFTTASNILLSTYTTQSLFYNGTNYSLNLLYRETGSNNSIYSGSTGRFGYLQFNIGAASVTSSTVPIFETGSDGDTSWYSVLVQRRTPDLRIGQTSTSQTYDIYIKNNVWGEVGHVASASLTTTTQNSSWYTSGTTLTVGGGTYPFSGSVQEFRLWSNYLSESTFDSHVLNPESIEGNYTSSAYNDLAARFPLGNNLYTANHSVITTTASVAPNQSIQRWTSSFANFPNRNNYSNFTETYYADVANSGYANPVNDKVRIYSGSLYGTQLLPNKSIEVPPLVPITKDIHLLDAGLSPQDEINKDIIAQLGSTYDLDNMIGDPRGTGYSELEKLRIEYFKKYVNKYNYKDFINLIEYFHNSLFRTLKDFIPARTNSATGIIIKNHLLERPAVEVADLSLSHHNNQSGSIDLLAITASNAMGITQPTYSYTQQTNLGPVTLTSDARDFFTGELPSASIFIHDDFDIANFNPYAIGYDPNKVGYYSSSVWNVEFNPLLNNVELNQLSSIRKKLTLIGGNAGFVSGSTYVTESIQLQDFTYTYARHANPRYNGSIVTSVNYNVYTNGDNTFGRNSAAIDKNTRQFAFISEVIATGSDLLAMPERSNVYIKYLIDETGSLTELTKRNYSLLSEDQKYNLYQVQNIFKSGEVVNVSLFDYQNPSVQFNLDGNKTIFSGGYRYYPVLWRTGSESLYYDLNPNVWPNGIPQSGWLSPNNFTPVVNTIFDQSSGTYTANVSVTYNAGATVLLDWEIKVDVSDGNSTQSITLVILSGQSSSSGVAVSGFNTPFVNVNIISVTPLGNTSGVFNSLVIDFFPNLWLNNTDHQTITASYLQSYYYGNGEGFTMTGSFIDGVPTSVDYPFSVNVGDLIRFASGSRFTPLEEYEVINVGYAYDANGTGSLTFKVNKRVNDIVTGSYSAASSSIDRYIFSRRIPDETNIVIQHRKNRGETSAGLAKNNNLAPDVDANMANIASDLKSKIFGTVFIP